MVLKKREKTLLFLASITVAIWAFDQFYYIPQKKRITTLREEVKAADLKLKEPTLLAQRVETVEAEVALPEKELQRLSNKMLQREEFRAFLKHLDRESKRLQMKIISMTPQEEKPSLPEGNKTPSAFRYRRVAIEMILRSRFYALSTYLNGIEELPFGVTVDHLQVERIGDGTSFLKVTMGLTVFVVSSSLIEEDS
jgi:hypothetical protein